MSNTHRKIILATPNGEAYIIVFTDEHVCEALYKLREWAHNPQLSLTHEQADCIADAIVENSGVG